jgi:hypothetical protein
VLKMGKPQSETVEALKLWLNGKSEGPTGRTVKSFQGLSTCRLDDDSDLVALHPPFESDWLMQLAQLPYLRLLFRVILNYMTPFDKCFDGNHRIQKLTNRSRSSR